MEERAILTAFSDLVLCIASLGSSRIVNACQTSTILGFIILAIASGLGCIRFGMMFPRQHNSVMNLHEYFSFLGSCSGLPLLAAGYCLHASFKQISQIFLVIAVAGPILDALGIFKRSLIREMSSTLSILVIMVVSLFFSNSGTNIQGTLGSLAFIVGGLVIGTDGKGFIGLANVDWFHYVLSLGVLLLANGLAV